MLAHAGAMFPHSRGNGIGEGGDAPHHPAIQLQLSPTGPGLGGVMGSLLGEPLITRINLMVLRDQQTKDEKLEPQGSLPSRGTACHGCACGGKARTDHPPGHGPSSPSLGRWLTAPLNSAAENSLLRSHWVLLVSPRTWQGMLSSGPDVDITMSLLTPAKHKQSFVSPGPCSIEERLLEFGG